MASEICHGKVRGKYEIRAIFPASEAAPGGSLIRRERALPLFGRYVSFY